MSYQSEVLADSPDLFLRLDVVPPATNGQTVPDLSGNGLDGTLTFSGSQEAWGHTSLIETDGSSTEFWGYTNAGVAGITGTSRIVVPHDDLISPDGDFTIGAWLEPRADIPSAGDFVLVKKGGACGIGLTYSGGTRFAAFVIDSAGTLYKAIDTSMLVTDHLNESFMVYAVRLGNALALYVNKKLKAVTTITSGLPTKQTTNDFEVHPNTGFYLNERYDEVFFKRAALTATRIGAQYDAARLTIPLRSKLTIRSTLTLDTTQEEVIDFPFSHNFASPFGDGEIPISERLSYFTDVIPSRTDYEQRITLRSHGPSRVLHYQVTPSSARAKAMLDAILFKPAQIYRLPISSDRTPLTADASSGDGTISLETVGRDFEPGSRLRLGTWDDYETCVIDGVTDTDVTIVGTLANDWPAGTPVVPARKARLLQNQIKSHLADHESVQLDFQILSDELSTNRAAAFTPALIYRDEEIFNLERVRVDFLDEVSVEDFRRVNTLDNKTGAIDQFTGDTGTARSIPVRLLVSDQTGKANFFGWLAVRSGQSTPLWIPSYENDLQAVSKSGSTLTIESIGYSQHYNLHSARRDVCFILNDGSFTCRRITDAVDNGDGTETLTFDDSVPTLTDVDRVSWLKYCRLNGDEVEFEWHRASASGKTFLECAVNFRELLTSPD